jgi:Protein O-mannosyl-transferase TMEM260-like
LTGLRIGSSGRETCGKRAPAPSFFDNYTGPAVLFTAFLIFVIWVCPTIYAGDSSLFAAASFSLGSAHPPGYPLFVILGKLLTFLPFGNVSLKVNLVSALAGALTCYMVFKTSMELTGNRPASWAAALVCGISPVFFSASLIAKGGAYTLNSFLAMCIFYLGIKIIRGKDVFRNSLLALFLIGLGMGNHHTIGFMGLIILVPLAIRWKDLSVRWALFGFLFFVLGFSVYLFLYLRSLAMADHGGLILYSYAGTFKDFIRVFFRQDYKGSSSPRTLEGAFSLGSAWLHGLRNSLYYVAFRSVKPVMLFLLLGLVGLRKRFKLLVFFIFSGIVWFLLLGKLVFSGSKPSISDVEVVSVYFLPAVPILYCLVSVGFAETLSFFRRMQWSMLAGFGSYALAALPFVFLPYTAGQYGLNRNVICYDYGRDMLMSLPEKSLLMNHGDNPMFTAFYMKGVERLREDVLVMDTAGRKGVFGLECAPPWKYAKLYPDFYHSTKSTIKEINDEFALKGKLFVDNPLNMTKVVARFYDYYPYIFSAALRPKTLSPEGFDSDIRRKFKRAFERTNYESVLAMPPSDDFLVQELTGEYGLNALFYSDFLGRDGNEKDADTFRRLALIMASPEKVLWPYINFLLKDGRKEEAFGLLAELEKTERYGELAHLLEKKALSVIQNK